MTISDISRPRSPVTNPLDPSAPQGTQSTASPAGAKQKHHTPLSQNPASKLISSQAGRAPQGNVLGKLRGTPREPTGQGTSAAPGKSVVAAQVESFELKQIKGRGESHEGRIGDEPEPTVQSETSDPQTQESVVIKKKRSHSAASSISSAESLPPLQDHVATDAANRDTLGAAFVGVEKAARDARLKLQDLTQAQARRGKDNPPDAAGQAAIAEASRQVIETNRRVLHEAIRALSTATKYPNTPMTPDARNLLATYGGMMVGALGFITAASLTAARPDKASEIFFPVMGLTVPVAKEAQAWATRKMGGGAIETLIRGGHSSFPGPFKKVGADFGQLTVSLLLYTCVSALFALPPEVGPFSLQHGAGPFSRALASSVVSGAGVLGTQALLVNRTLRNNDVERSDDLAITRHNRSLKGAVGISSDNKLKIPAMEAAAVMQALPKWNDRTTGEFKIKELGIAIASSLLGAAGAYGVAHGIGNATAPVDPQDSFRQGQSLVAVIGVGVLTYFAASAALQLLVTKWRNHPAAHAHRPFGQAESEVLARQISKSAFSIAERYLDELGRDLEGGKLGPKYKRRFEAANKVLSGAAKRTGDGQAIDDLARQLKAAAGFASLSRRGPIEAEAERDDAAGPYEKIAGERPHDGAMSKIEEWAGMAAASLEKLNSTANGTEVQFAMNDATQRLRDLQFLLLECHYQSQGATKPAMPGATGNDGVIKVLPADDRINRVANALMPAFAALRKNDRYEAAKGFAEAMENYHTGALTAQEAVQLVASPNAHKRVLMKNIADLVIQTGQDRALFLRVFDQMVHDAGHDGTPFTQAKAAMLHNALNRHDLSMEEEAAARQQVTDTFDNLRTAAAAGPQGLAGGALAAGVKKSLNDADFTLEMLQDALHDRQALMDSDDTVRNAAREADRLATEAEVKSNRLAKVAADADTAAGEAEAAVRNAAAPAAPGADIEAGAVSTRDDAERLRREADEAAEKAKEAKEASDARDMEKQEARAELDKVEAATAELKAFEAAMGDGFREALTQEVRNGLLGEDPVHMNKAAAAFIGTMLDDVEAMHEANKVPLKTAMSIPHSTQKAELTPRVYTDTHAHPTGYSGNVTSQQGIGNSMDSAGVLMSVMAGIPSQVWGFTAKAKYYANALFKTALDYRSHDDQLANDYKALPPDLQKRLILSITGIDLTNPASMEKVLDQRMRDHPGVFRGVGEVTWMKEIVSKMQLHIPTKRAVVLLMKLCAMRGLPVLLHCDRGEPGSKNKFEAAVIEALDEANKSVEEWRTQDKLAQKLGLENVPPPKSTVVWAHGGGKSRFTPEGQDHTMRMAGLLDTRKNLKWDASWDFVNNDMLQNLHDQLTARNVAPKMRQGLQDVIKAYEAFAALGGRSDKADDLGDKNQSAALRVAAEKATDLYFHAVEDFKRVAQEEFRDDRVVAQFADMATQHGVQGNNWFYLMAKHPDRAMFGTDSLQIGMKAHGDAAYAMNTKVMEPMLLLFDELAAKRPDIAGVQGLSEKVCVQNFKDTWLDKDMAQRRAAHEQSLQDEQPTDWSSRQSTKWTAEDNPVTQAMIDELPRPDAAARGKQPAR